MQLISKCAIPLVTAVRDRRGEGGGRRWVRKRVRRRKRRWLFYLESLLMTRMSAPFSSFSLWLSAFKSGSIWKRGNEGTREGERVRGGGKVRGSERERDNEKVEKGEKKRAK